MIDLDAPESYAALDRSDMLSRITDLGRQMSDAWSLSSRLALPKHFREPAAALVLGMGGSAIGGDLARALTARYLSVPLAVSREYELPGWVGRDTLVIVSSYSGNTEETLGAARQALERGARLVAVTTGGELERMAREHGLPLVQFTYPAQPRAALGYSLFLILGVLARAGLIPETAIDPETASTTIRRAMEQLGPQVPTTDNRAKQVARALHGKLAVIYGGGLLAEVARRWKGQLNENSKQWAFYEQLPELNHNAVVGYQFPRELARRIVVVMLSSALNHPRLLVREEVTRELLDRAGVQCEVLASEGSDELSHVLWSIVQGDFVSYYLALLNGVDPSTIDAIDYLKRRLTEK